MTDINQWSSTDDNNNSASPAGYPEGMAPSGVNNSARAVMGALKRFRDQLGPSVTSGGSANTQTLTYSPTHSARATGDVFVFIAGFTNSGATTLNVDGLGAVAVLSADGGALTGREIQAGKIVRVYDNGTNYILDGIGAELLTPTNGHVYLPGSSIILKFGYLAIAAADTGTVNFTSAFPNAVLGAFLGPVGSAGAAYDAFVGALSASALTINLSTPLSTTIYWLCIGY